MTIEQMTEFINGLQKIAIILAIGHIILIIALICAIFNISSNTSKMLELMKDLHYYKRLEFESEYEDDERE